MKFRNEESRKTIYFGSLYQGEYWQQFNQTSNSNLRKF